MYFIIQNCYINAGDYGIYFTGVSDWVGNIDNNTCEGNSQYGISLQDSLGMNVTNNKCFYNGVAGIYTNYADNSNFINNTCMRNDKGIHLFDTYDAYVINNTCSENTYGILLELAYGTEIENNTCNDQDYGIINSGAAVIKNNICTNLTWEGITLEDCNNLYVAYNYFEEVEVSALYIGVCQSITVTNNTIINSFRGIYVDNTNESTFTYNLIQDNTYYGIHASLWSSNNTYHHNSFISNAMGIGLSQAYDLGNYSTWYDDSVNEGNYWDDWVGIGGYNIEGDGEFFVDLYPLSESPMPKISEFYGKQSLILALLISVAIPTVLLARKRKRG
jgi:parallel beta-helix repeat protein